MQPKASRIRISAGLAGLIAIAVWSGPPVLWGEEKVEPAKTPAVPAPAKVVVELGGEVRATTSDSDHTSKFEEHRDVPKGIILKTFELQLEDANRPFRFDLRGLDLTQRDQKATVNF
ncbi:MAG: hypothetical protein HYS61_01230, partial [Acidobacteria bacterium]|nr:hypothetical protein [Acidobacteriota bacterium]